MKPDIHQQARELIALTGVEGLAGSQQNWLQSHLQDCESCRNYADSAHQLIRSIRSVPIAADSRLVRATQMRVRFHATRLRETRERMWFVGIACLGVGLSAAVTAPLLWRFFAWMGEWAGVSSTVWQAAFTLFWIAPALGAGLLLLARGTYLSAGGTSQR